MSSSDESSAGRQQAAASLHMDSLALLSLVAEINTSSTQGLDLHCGLLHAVRLILLARCPGLHTHLLQCAVAGFLRGLQASSIAFEFDAHLWLKNGHICSRWCRNSQAKNKPLSTVAVLASGKPLLMFGRQPTMSSTINTLASMSSEH